MKKTFVATLGVLVVAVLALAIIPTTRDEIHWRWASHKDETASYECYVRTWPEGRHAAEAQARYDEHGWADATAANTIRSYRTYISAHSQGRFAQQAETKATVLLTDRSVYDAALRTGTEASFRAFLAEYPGHINEAAAQQALRDITEERDIVDLLAEKKIEIQTQGSGIQSVSVRVRKVVSYPLTVRIPVGSYFVSASQSSQDMVITAESKVRVASNGWQSVSPSAACANRSRDIPSSKDSFSVQRSPYQAELATLMPRLDEARVDYATRQAAVWIVTDDATYSNLGILETRYSGGGSARTIHETETARAMKICDEAGIDITRKAIWRDRQQIISGLKDGDLKTWLEQKTVLGIEQENMKSLMINLNRDDYFARESAAQQLVKIGAPAVKSLIELFQEQGKDFQERVLKVLVSIGSPLVEPLIISLSDTRALVRMHAAGVLGEIKDRQAVLPLIGALQDKDPDVRSYAAEALGKIKDERAVEPLIRVLEEGRGDPRYQPIIIQKIGDEVIVYDMRGGKGAARYEAARALGEIKDPRAVEPLIEALQDADIIASIAEASIKEIGAPAFDSLVVAFLHYEKKDVRKRVVSLLAKIGDPRAIEPATGRNPRAIESLILALQDQDKEVRISSAHALGFINDPRVVKPLIGMLQDQDDGVRQEAAFALGGLKDPRVVAPLIRALRDKNDDVRRNAAGALASIKDPRAVGALIKALQDKDYYVRRKAAAALGDFGDKRAVSALVHNLTDWVLAPEVVEALSKLGWTAASRQDEVHWLVAKRNAKALRDEQWLVAKQVLLSDIESADYRTIENALFAFIGIGREEILPELIEKLNTSENKTTAKAYFNCGHPKLQGAAREWASRHGYQIEIGTTGSYPVNWGSM